MVKKSPLFLLITIIFSYIFFVAIPQRSTLDSANFTNASDTLSNSRLSYRAGVASGSSGSSVVTIDSTAHADNDTNHLFPNDTLCFTDAGLNGCIGDRTYTVANIVNSTTFNISPPLEDSLDTSGYAVASQSASHTVAFTLANAVPSDGDILLTIPAINTDNITSDGLPDTNETVATNGFDINNLLTTDVSISSSGCANNWTVAAVTAGSSSTDHTIRIDRSTTSCAASSTITVTVGNGSTFMINPAPANNTSTPNHTQGVADVYTINIKTRDGSDNTLDQSYLKVAVIEGVLVSATIQETLSLTVAGVASSTTACGQTTDITTTATSVPWGTIASFAAFQEAAQTVTVSTNADAGYSVKIDENDQMGKDGVTCTGASAGESVNCVQDTLCGSTPCSESTGYYWTGTSYYGMGYSLANVSGTNASFVYDSTSEPCTTTGGGTATNFCSRQFPDLEATESKTEIMTSSGPVASSQIYLCYRLNVSSTQPAGYYFNKVRYTATATF